MLFTETKHHAIVDTTAAATVGRVRDLLVDPRRGAVVALHLERGADGDTIRWADIAGFGPDAVTIASRAAVRTAEGRAAELLEGDHRLIGKRLLTDAGDEVGTVVDVAFDPSTGAVTELRTDDMAVPGDRLLGCGKYAVVVRHT